MPLWPYGTRMRDGAPATVNLTAEQIEIFYATVPLAWAAPILGLIGAEEIDVAEMCSHEPPPDETWNVNDIVRALVGSTQTFERAKLRRMAIAAIWPSYCEYREGPDAQMTVQLVHTLGDFFGAQNVDDPFVAVAPIGNWGQNMYTIEVIGAGASPPSTGFLATGSATENLSPMILGSSAFVYGQTITLRPGDNIGTPEAPYIWPQAGDTHWRFNTTTSTDQIAPVNIQYWNVSGLPLLEVVPPDPQPWPEAPEDPFIGPVNPETFQFTWEQVDAIVTAAEAMPGVESNVQNINSHVNDLVETNLPYHEELLAAIAALGVEASTAIAAAGTPHVVDSNQSWSVPPEAVGFFVWILETNGATSFGSNPDRSWGVGHVTQAWGDTYWASEPIKHSREIFYPMHEGADSIAFDLHPSTIVGFDWLVAATP